MSRVVRAGSFTVTSLVALLAVATAAGQPFLRREVRSFPYALEWFR